MRRVLAIDTSTATGRIALAAGQTVFFAREFNSQRSHNSQIFSPLQSALDCCNRELDLIAVGTGPGSYTGVRIGIASGIATAMALEIPVIGIPSACAAAVAAGNEYTLIGDARRGSTFLAEANGHRLEGEPELIDNSQLPARLENHERALFSFDEKKLPGSIATQPSATKIAVLAACLDESELNRLQGIAPEPVYLREPFVTEPKKPGKAVS
ncbi:MAG: tRNA (adenosine(37)-N6)-threonylcarbamoyltransferase complex dimerization subunit type 1 TsaB [Verrucomicrobiaceae bacterium]|nr:tRNA (adenosine(37)-N6)-threonylcarbamoyltransferase complex dimerization subunit type 1 TsaB [Verrucomicrobiaceae bacterium]